MDIIIVCDDSFALDVKMIIESINRSSAQGFIYHIIGYLTIEKTPCTFLDDSIKWFGSIDEWTGEGCKSGVIAVADPQKRKNAVKILKEKEMKFVSLVAPWSAAPEEFQMGEGTIMAAESIQAGQIIGDFVILYQTLSDAESVIGNYTTILGGTNINNAHIGECVYIGSNCVILMDLSIADKATIYPGSLIMKNVSENQRMMGIPARPLEIFCKRNEIDISSVRL